MDVFDKFFRKFAYKFDKGYPDMNNTQDVFLLESLIQGLGVDFKFDQLIFEVSDSEVKNNTEQAIDVIIKNTSKGFKKQSDRQRLGNPDKVSPEEFQQIVKDSLAKQLASKVASHDRTVERRNIQWNTLFLTALSQVWHHAARQRCVLRLETELHFMGF